MRLPLTWWGFIFDEKKIYRRMDPKRDLGTSNTLPVGKIPLGGDSLP